MTDNTLENSVADSDIIAWFSGLDLNCYSVQMPAPPLSTLAAVIVASIGTWNCYLEWHNFSVYTESTHLIFGILEVGVSLMI